MSKKPKIPDTWGIPDDQAIKIQETLRKKPIQPEDAVQKAIEDLACDIAVIETDPKDWAWWVSYLFEQLQAEAGKDFKAKNFEAMLDSLLNRISTRIEKGKW